MHAFNLIFTAQVKFKKIEEETGKADLIFFKAVQSVGLKRDSCFKTRFLAADNENHICLSPQFKLDLTPEV